MGSKGGTIKERKIKGNVNRSKRRNIYRREKKKEEEN